MFPRVVMTAPRRLRCSQRPRLARVRATPPHLLHTHEIMVCRPKSANFEGAAKFRRGRGLRGGRSLLLVRKWQVSRRARRCGASWRSNAAAGDVASVSFRIRVSHVTRYCAAALIARLKMWSSSGCCGQVKALGTGSNTIAVAAHRRADAVRSRSGLQEKHRVVHDADAHADFAFFCWRTNWSRS